VLYCDTSALVKLVVREPETAELATWLDERRDRVLCVSVIGKVELLRASRRHAPASTPRALRLLARLALIPLTADIVDSASTTEPAWLRSLDALHLASAASLGSSLSELVGYDERLLQAASAMGITVASPGLRR
jgi:predicted nucleic acid-binding protein